MKRLVALGLLILVGTTANAVEYNVTVLQSLSPGNASDSWAAYGLNDSGQVVGQAYNSTSGVTEAVLWNVSSGGSTILSLGFQGIARDVNNAGTVVGEQGVQSSNNSNNTGDGRAYKWDSTNGYVDLGSLIDCSPQPCSNPTNAFSGAFAINESGVITGNSYTVNSPFGLLSMHAFRWEGGTMTDLPPPNAAGGYSRGISINDLGTIIGRASIDTFTNSDKHMAQWDPSNTFEHFIGPFDYSAGRDINNNNVAVGLSKNINGNDRATIWAADGTRTQIDMTLGGARSLFNSINDAGVAVGFSHADGGLDGEGQQINIAHAIISYDGTTFIDLNTVVDLTGTGFVLLNEATAINENGDIVGIGTLADGTQAGFFIAAIPIPAAVWLFGSALGALGWLRRRSM